MSITTALQSIGIGTASVLPLAADVAFSDINVNLVWLLGVGGAIAVTVGGVALTIIQRATRIEDKIDSMLTAYATIEARIAKLEQDAEQALRDQLAEAKKFTQPVHFAPMATPKGAR